MSIVLKNINFSYGSKKILQNINITFAAGHPTAITGSSGCGKTTLLHILAGLKTPDGGTVTGLSSTGTAMVFQEDRLLPHLSVYGNLQLVNKQLTCAQAAELLRQVGLEGELDSLPRSLSGGMNRRVAIVQAIVFDHSPIILDEPFSGLDTKTKTQVMDFLKHHTEDKILVLVTHDPKDADYLGAITIELKSSNQ